MDNPLFKKSRMTTALAIKCNDGIVLASDSQGTDRNIRKETLDKVLKINKSVGLVTAGNVDQIHELVRYFKNIPEDYNTEKDLSICLNKCLSELHKRRYSHEDIKIEASLDDDLYFSPEAFIGARLKNGEFYLYNEKFGILLGAQNKVISAMYLVDEYGAIGSGFNTALNFLEYINDIYIKKLNKKLCELPVEINVGIAMSVIHQAKKSDLYSGGDTQIGIIDDEKGFRKISVEKQSAYYCKMIKYLSESLKETEDKIKEHLPVSITALL